MAGVAHEIMFVTEVTSATRLKVSKIAGGVGTPVTKSALYTAPAVGHKVVVDVLLDGDRVVAYPIA